jgi:hypothetical protein
VRISIRTFFGLGLIALAFALSSLVLMLFAMKADERISSPVWVDWLIQSSGSTPLGFAYRLEAIASIAVLIGFGLLLIAAYMWRRMRSV